MNTANISAEQFVQRYPELFALYRELMLVTKETVDARKALLTRESDDQLRTAQRTLETTVAEAAAKFRENTAAFVAAYNMATRAAQDELNAMLSRFLEEKDEATKPHNDAKLAELSQLEAQKLATQECFHELKLFSFLQAAADDFQKTAFRIIQHHDEALTPIASGYSDAVRRAYEKYNATLLRAQSVCNDLCEPHILAQKRAVLEATNKNQADLLRASFDRDERSANLQAMIAHFREERLQEIERFLHEHNEVALRQYLTAAIEQMKERRDSWSRNLSGNRVH